MKLKLKPEYLVYSIGGGRTIKKRLKNVHPSEFEALYNAGYSEFFEVIDEKPKKVVKDEIIEKENNNDIDDTNK